MTVGIAKMVCLTEAQNQPNHSERAYKSDLVLKHQINEIWQLLLSTHLIVALLLL
jgi:hypothetical protein